MKRRVKLVIADRSNVPTPIKSHKMYNELSRSMKLFGDEASISSMGGMTDIEQELRNFTTVVVHGTWSDTTPNDKSEKKILKSVSDLCKKTNKELIVLETQLLTRIVADQTQLMGNNKHHRIGLNHWLYNKGTFIKNADASRWDKLKQKYKLTFRPWKKDGDYVLIVLGFDQDPSNDISSFDFINSVVPDIKKHIGAKILVRVHPLSKKYPEYMSKLKLLIDQLGLVFDLEENFIKSLDKTLLCVMYNSTSVFQAIYRGIPCYTNVTNFGYNIGVRDIQDFADWQYPNQEDWFVEMSWLTYSRQEIEDKNFWPFIVEKLLNENNNNN